MTTLNGGGTVASHGGRGARERILLAANDLFYRQGINTTGIEELAATAHVSKRTLYKHFASKDKLIVAYLDRIRSENLTEPGAILARKDLAPRQKLLDLFTDVGLRGCPFLNATAELSDVDHPARHVASEQIGEFIDKLIGVAREAGARDPQLLGHQLAVLSSGVRAQCAALNSSEPAKYARAAAEVLVDQATGDLTIESGP